MTACGALQLALLLAGAARAEAAPAAGRPAAGECRSCHSSDTPSRQEPALHPCPRFIHKGSHSPAQAPRIIVFEGGAAPRGGVRFSHREHARMAQAGKGCYGCHHFNHSKAISPCKECHSASRSREDHSRPDLRGALHRQCMDCHRDWGGGTDCAFCHEKRAAGAGKPHAPWLQNRFHRELECRQCHPLSRRSFNPEKRCEACHPGWRERFDHKKTGFPLNEPHAALGCEGCHAEGGYSPAPSCANCHPDGPPKKETPGHVP